MLKRQYSSLVEGTVAWFQLANSVPRPKRLIFIAMMALSAGFLFFNLVFAAAFAMDRVDFALNTVMMLALVATAILLWRHVQRQELLLLCLYLFVALYIVALMTHYTLRMMPQRQEPSLLECVAPWMLWLIVLDVGCFFTFRALTALRLSLIMAGIAVFGALSIVWHSLPIEMSAAHDILALSLANGLVVLFVYQMARAQEHSSQTDFLTGLPNRLHGYSILSAELDRAGRYQRIFSVILFDLDNFKQVNDRFGHPAGDAILRDFTNFVQQHIRRSDLFARWGGEEFILIMPESDLASGRLKADYLRQQIKNRAFHQGIRITSSFGVTVYYPRDTTQSLLERADAALYRAKANGRNCVEVE